jgi:hypothetical protein
MGTTGLVPIAADQPTFVRQLYGESRYLTDMVLMTAKLPEFVDAI